LLHIEAQREGVLGGTVGSPNSLLM
jgi:hypothetical protein